MTSNSINHQFWKLKLLHEEFKSNLQDYVTLKSLSGNEATPLANDDDLVMNLTKMLNTFKYLEIMLIDLLNELENGVDYEEDEEFCEYYSKFKDIVATYRDDLNHIEPSELVAPISKYQYEYTNLKNELQINKEKSMEQKQQQELLRQSNAKLKKQKSVRFKESLIDPKTVLQNDPRKPYHDDPLSVNGVITVTHKINKSSNNNSNTNHLFTTSSRYSDSESDAASISSDPMNLSNKQLFIDNQQELLNQDAIISSLSQSVSTQHQMGLEIHSELDEHMVLLEDLEHGLGRTDNKITRGRTNLKRFSDNVRENGEYCTIFVLIVILLMLLIVLK
ncbi:hypothetical protein CANARDRAFT_6301 [[Candida] arabinofermentans NRRL YB-2248]|uniref:t-SNARE coiled-coil homology domain-containing protein n=1 Tax=[Candida] arabinofermentans NRRL YB-2248 TaxID=983967 RepID=A0A1E4T4Y1_9ASCO|nr:hypothetical protein CANARDRAFT_6301 [[Candida] arabinofermentans NRRL YB-2248]